MPQPGDYVAFRWAGRRTVPGGRHLRQGLAGMPGDAVTRDGSGASSSTAFRSGMAKTVSRQGQPLEPGPTGGSCPPGRYYVRARHPDSLDSRYQLTGWIPTPRSSDGPMRCSDRVDRSARPAAGRCARMALVAAAMLASVAARAQDLGVIGPVYPIAEPSLLEVILAKLRDARSQRRARPTATRRASPSVKRRRSSSPPPSAELTKTTKRAQLLLRPEHRRALRHSRCRRQGASSPPGTMVNPLDTVSLSQALLFIDARDAAQVERAQRKLIDERQGKVKVILTGGSYLDLMRRWKRPVFFDQQGNAHRRSSASVTCRRSSPRTARGCASMRFCRPVHRQPVAVAALWLALAGLLALLPGPAAAGPTCHGRFMNPITDICWSCLFPLTIGSASILSDGQPDIGNPSSPVCYCSNPPRIGVSIGFWEPVRLVDVTRTPFCMVGLGGIALDPGSTCRAAPRSATTARRATASITCTGTPTRSSPGSKCCSTSRAWRRARSIWSISPRSIRCGPTTSSPPS